MCDDDASHVLTGDCSAVDSAQHVVRAQCGLAAGRRSGGTIPQQPRQLQQDCQGVDQETRRQDVRGAHHWTWGALLLVFVINPTSFVPSPVPISIFIYLYICRVLVRSIHLPGLSMSFNLHHGQSTHLNTHQHHTTPQLQHAY